LTVKVGLAFGRCPKCGRVYVAHRPTQPIQCDCWRTCPICGREMKPYTPDLTPSTYGLDGKGNLKILLWCDRHTPPYYSSQKPVEVTLE